MDFSDATVVTLAKDEEAVFSVVAKVLESLEGCRVIVPYNGYGGKELKFRSARVKAYPAPDGYGRAIRMVQGKGIVKTPIVCFIDADATYEPKDLRKLIGMVRDGYDMALGNRFGGITRESMPLWIQFGNRAITMFGNLLHGLDLGDSQSGLRALRTEVFQSIDLVEPGFGIATEMDIKMKREGFRIGEAHAGYYPRVGETKQRKMTGGMNHILIEFRLLSYRPRNQKVLFSSRP